MKEKTYPTFEVALYLKVEMQGVDSVDAIHRVEDTLGLNPGRELTAAGGNWTATGRIGRMTVLDANPIKEKPTL